MGTVTESRLSIEATTKVLGELNSGVGESVDVLQQLQSLVPPGAPPSVSRGVGGSSGAGAPVPGSSTGGGFATLSRDSQIDDLRRRLLREFRSLRRELGPAVGGGSSGGGAATRAAGGVFR